MPYLSATAVVIHYEEALYQVYGPLPFNILPKLFSLEHDIMSMILSNIFGKYFWFMSFSEHTAVGTGN